MQVSHREQDGVEVYAVNGRIDSNTAPALEDRVVGAIADGARAMVVDLSGVPYISSAGLRVFLLALKRMNAVQGRLVLAGLSGDVKQVFDIAGFSMLFATHPDADAAVAALAG